MFLLSKNKENKEIIEIDEMEPISIKLTDPITSHEIENFINNSDEQLPIINEEESEESENISNTIEQTNEEIKENLRLRRRKYLKKIFNEAIEKIENMYNEDTIEDCEDDHEYSEEEEENDDEDDDADDDADEDDDEYDEDDDEYDEDDDDDDENNENKYVISINDVPYFYFDTLSESRKSLQRISKKLSKQSRDFAGYVKYDTFNKNKLTVFRIIDFILFKHNYVMYNIQIDVVGKSKL